MRTINRKKHNVEVVSCFCISSCYVDNKICVHWRFLFLSLSLPPFFSIQVIVRARSLVHSAELFNVISFSILSADFLRRRGEEREKEKNLSTRKKRGREKKLREIDSRTESNTMNSINLFFRALSKELPTICLLFLILSDERQTYRLIDGDG